MFAREAPEGWDVFGNEAPGSIKIRCKDLNIISQFTDEKLALREAERLANETGLPHSISMKDEFGYMYVTPI